ncbi:Hypothetical protein A7982_02614 [Minicystis rosea]|nr:Hypothetical protein A7982_02614 [Minicystis rosea]
MSRDRASLSVNSRTPSLCRNATTARSGRVEGVPRKSSFDGQIRSPNRV